MLVLYKIEDTNMKKAFTLAEVLITIVVIGIVAAITINIIISNQEEAYRSGLKKSYSILQQAFKKATTDNGGFLPVNCGSDAGQNLIQLGDVILKSNMRVAKDCYKSSCFAKNTKEIRNFNNTATYDTYKSNMRYRSAFIIQDGSFYRIDNYRASGPVDNVKYNYIYVLSDVNGLNKGPNRLGKDIFYFEYDVEDERLIPGGQIESLQNMNICDKSNTHKNNGFGCADLIIRGEKLPK